MRGCLFVLLLAAAIVGAGAWFGSPTLASVVIESALDGAGLHAASRSVRATSDPPPKLLLGHADRVEIAATDVDFRTFHAAALHLVLTDVDVLGRTAATIRGSITGAEMRTSDGDPASADVMIDGSGTAADATIDVAGTTVDRVVRAAFRREFGVAVNSTELLAPDTLRISATGSTLEGRLALDGSGAIVLTTALGSAPILSLDPSFPLTFRSVSVVEGDLRIMATLDAQALLGG